ncbi:MAG TPA: diguanylate cyclase [bacterium (Candidatus Stahlbacteria)]|nr:diguanylate cyclase [Candidatus Stahlbacteria bacterium]
MPKRRSKDISRRKKRLSPDRVLAELEISRRLDRVFGTTYDLGKLVRRITREIGKVIDISSFYFALYNDADKQLDFIIYYEDGKELPHSSRGLSGGMTEYVIQKKKPLLINRNIKGVCRKLGITPYGRDAQSWLGIPISYRGDVLGVMTVQDYHNNDAFTQEDSRFLRNVAAKIGMVLWSTRQVESQRRKASLFRLLAQVAKRSTKYLNLNQVLKYIDKAIKTNAPELSFRLYIKDQEDLNLFTHANDQDWEFDLPLILSLGRFVTEEETIIAFPLNWRRTIIGFFTIRFGAMTPKEEIRIFESLADQIAIAIGNALIFQEIRERARRLNIAFETGRWITATLNLDGALNRIVNAAKGFGGNNVAIFLIDPKTNELYIRAYKGDYSLKRVKRTRLKVGKRGVSGHVASTGKEYYTPDVKNDPYFYGLTKKTRSEASFPLKVRDKVIGVLSVESYRQDAFSVEDRLTLSLLASVASIAIENASLYEETRELSLIDPLTRIANRRHFKIMVENELRHARRFSQPFSVAMLDLDHFKNFNDRYGHPIGDRLLIHVATVISTHLREADFVARYGGEEFIVVLPATDTEEAIAAIERIRKGVELNPLKRKKTYRITISGGIATYPIHGLTAKELIVSADSALYYAKRRGRNRVEVSS